MATLPQTLQFSDDFPPISKTVWEEKIKKDLRGVPLEKLLWDAGEDLQLPAYVQDGDVQEPVLPAFGPARSRNTWAIRENIYTETDDAAVVAEIAEALSHGATSIGLLAPISGGIDLTAPSLWTSVCETLADTPAALHLVAGTQSLAVYDACCQALLAHTAQVPGTVDAAPLRDILSGTATTADLPAAWSTLADRMTDAATPYMRLLHIDVQAFAQQPASEMLALALAMAADAFDALTERSLSADQIAAHAHVSLPLGTSYFLEIAKLRAARIVFQRFLNAYDVPCCDIFVRGVQAPETRDPETGYDNLLRATSVGAAAAIGGCDEIILQPHAVGSSPNARHARQLCRNVQLILQAESHLNRVIDPARGSYYLEVLTQQLVEKSWSRFLDLERDGGFLYAIAADRIAPDDGTEP